MHTYYIESCELESLHNLTNSLAPGSSLRLQSRSYLWLRFHMRLDWGRTHFLINIVDGSIQFFVGYGTLKVTLNFLSHEPPPNCYLLFKSVEEGVS